MGFQSSFEKTTFGAACVGVLRYQLGFYDNCPARPSEERAGQSRYFFRGQQVNELMNAPLDSTVLQVFVSDDGGVCVVRVPGACRASQTIWPDGAACGSTR